MFKKERIKAILCDLDYTLYDQSQYHARAFKKIAEILQKEYTINETFVVKELKQIYAKNTSRGNHNLDELLHNLGPLIPQTCDKTALIKQLIDNGYHGVTPAGIVLYDGVRDMLTTIKNAGIKLGIITDGKSETQKRKVAALGIETLFDVLVYSDDIKDANSVRLSKKMSYLPYFFALQKLGISIPEAHHTVFVGDNPRVDFHYAFELGMTTVRVLTGEYALQKANPSYIIQHEIASFADLQTLIQF